MASASAANVPPFSLAADRYDQSTYLGRFRQFLETISPTMLLTSDKELADARKLLADFKATGTIPVGLTDADMWAARRVKEAIIHPDLDEEVPIYGRMSTFLPMNIPIAAGMVMFGTNPAAQLFWQWANQSYNATLNYCNRNATVPVSTAELAVSYVSATSVAMGLAWGLGRLTKHRAVRSLPAGPRFVVETSVPFTAVAAAGIFNVLAMRYKEAVDGIQVFDADGTCLGSSVVAGRDALTKVAITRVVLPIPILFMPPLVSAGLASTSLLGPLMAAGSIWRIPIDLTCLAGLIWVALPAAVAVFPQKVTMDVSELEPQFQSLVLKDGTPVRTVTYNKGL